MTSKVTASVLFICDSQCHWINLSWDICIANRNKFRKVPMPRIPNLEQISSEHGVRRALVSPQNGVKNTNECSAFAVKGHTYQIISLSVSEHVCVCVEIHPCLCGLRENPVTYWIYVHNWSQLPSVWSVIQLHYWWNVTCASEEKPAVLRTKWDLGKTFSQNV